MSPTLTILVFAGLVALHFWWRARMLRKLQLMRSEAAQSRGRELAAEAEARGRQDALFDSMIEGVLVLDQTGRVQFANRAFVQMFATSGVLRERTLLEVVRLEKVVEIVARTAYEGRVVDQELRMSDAEDRWLQVNAAALTSVDHQRLGTILVFHDVTRIKKLERTREEFVANVSHELRTPLSLIKGYVETLLDGANDNPEVATKFLQTIDRNTRRLDLLIQDLLTISELESGRMKLNLQPVTLQPLVNEVFASVKERAAQRRMKLVNALPQLRARADGDRLEQVLANLMGNAVKYGRDDGTVTVGGRATEDGKVEVFVQDDGPGIPAEALERVFERFYRVDKARSREQGGTGLGLAIVKHIVQSHGGAVWVQSEVGRGAAFYFTLPVSA